VTRHDVIVVSHRRSGTHFAIDAIRNNFAGYRREHVDLDHLRPSHPAGLTLDEVRRAMAAGPSLFKSHMLPDPGRFFGDAAVARFVRDLLDRARIVYVHRDGRDVLVSLYHYAQNFDPAVRRMGFAEFLRMDNEFDASAYEGPLKRVEYWCRHVAGWVDGPGILTVGFDELLRSFDGTLARLARLLERPLPERVCRVRRRALPGGPLGRLVERLRTRVGSRYSSVGFRKGVSGDHARLFAPEDAAYFEATAGATMRRLGYEV
jgi:hypothetical protein